jgi:hypothetical protein
MLLRSPIRRLQDLVAAPPLDVGTVASVSGGIATVDLVGGGSVNARGAATVGQQVYVRGGVIEGVAPSLSVDLIEV